MFENRKEDRRRSGKIRDLFGLDKPEHLLDIECRDRIDRSPNEKCREPAARIAEDMEEGIDDEVAVAFDIPIFGYRIECLPNSGAVQMADTFRSSGAARREHDVA